MNAKTKLQKKIILLSAELLPLTEEQKNYYVDNCSNEYITSSKKGRMTCLHCGHRWMNKASYIPKSTVCPHCKKRQEVEITLARKMKFMNYFLVTTTVEDMQVWRMFAVEHFLEKGKPVQYQFHEVFQRWLSPEGKSEVMSLLRYYDCFYYDRWNYNSSFELRSSDCHQSFNVYPHVHYHESFIPRLEQVGVRLLFDNDLFNFKNIRAILKDNRYETLLKVNQIELFEYLVSNRLKLDDYWNSIRICLRHNYRINSSWFIYVDRLRYLQKDLRNPHFVCPDNFNEANIRIREMYERKYNREMERRRQEQELQEIKENLNREANYQSAKGKFLGLEISNGKITIKPLQNVQEFYDEGKTMHHCVYAQKYYQKQNSLILSAKLDGERLETIEVNLANYSIVQSRGKYNANSEYHDEIITLINQHMCQISGLNAA